MQSTITPFRASIPENDLVDLRARLRRTRWPDSETVEDWSQGVPLRWLQELCAYWQDDYDWRRCERRLNELPQFVTSIDGSDVHFLHLRSPDPSATPLLLTHGWPGAVLEFLDVVEPLADPLAHGGDPDDAFHVVCPTLPGYGFSGKPNAPGWGVDRIADLWAELMVRLGYSSYGLQGGDWGAVVSAALARRHPTSVLGLHVNFFVTWPEVDEETDLTDRERLALDDWASHLEWGRGYSTEQATRPQTLGYGLTDSPAGQCAWIVEKFWAWTDHDGDPTDAVSREQMLDIVTLYWLTASATSSARLYWETGRLRRPDGSRQTWPEPLSVPSAVSIFPREISRPSRRWCERNFADLRFYEEAERGGHFAALEQPELFVDQVRRAFSSMTGERARGHERGCR